MDKFAGIFIFSIIWLGIILYGCEFDEVRTDMSPDIEKLGNVSASFVTTKNKYKWISELQVTCKNGIQHIDVISSLNRSDVESVAKFTIEDTTSDLYSKIHYGVTKVNYLYVPDYYLHENCIKGLNKICNPKSDCMKGKKTRADCHLNCSIYDLATEINRAYPNAVFRSNVEGDARDEEALYGISLR